MSYLRTVPAFGVLLLFPLFIIALLVGIVAIPVTAIAAGSGSGFVVPTLLLVITLVGSIAYAVREYRSWPRPHVDGPFVERAEAADLWRIVDETAHAVRTRTVDRITVSATVGAAVFQAKGLRFLEVGLPTIALLSEKELRAVLAHELGHFAGGRHAASSVLLRARMALVTMARNATGVWSGLFRAYARVFISAERFSSREMERAADDFAVRLAGSDAAARALRNVVVSGHVWTELRERFFTLPASYTDKRAPLVQGAQQLFAADPERFTQQADETVAQQTASLWDSHPVTRDRIARAQAQQIAPPPTADRRAFELFPHIDVLESELFHHERKLVSWPDLWAEARCEYDRRGAEATASWLTRLGTISRPTTGALLSALAEIPVSDSTQHAERRAMREAVVLYALQWGAPVRFVFAWQPSGYFADEHGPVNIDALVDADLNTLLRELEQRGVDLDRDLVSMPEIRPLPDDALLGAVTITSLGRGLIARDALAFPSGILLSPSNINGFSLAAGGARADRQHERIVQRVQSEGLDVLRAQKRAIWMPRGSIRSVTRKRGRILIERVEQSRPVVLRETQYSTHLGNFETAFTDAAHDPQRAAA